MKVSEFLEFIEVSKIPEDSEILVGKETNSKNPVFFKSSCFVCDIENKFFVIQYSDGELNLEELNDAE